MTIINKVFGKIFSERKLKFFPVVERKFFPVITERERLRELRCKGFCGNGECLSISEFEGRN